jgi:hypothetical protein
MSRSIRILVPLLVVGCSSSDPEGLGSAQQNLYRAGSFESSGTTVSADTGVADTSTKADTSIIVKSPDILYPSLPTAPCAPVRYDIVTTTRTCWDLARTTATGTWTVTPLYSSAPASIRDKHCAATWIAKSPTCALPDIESLGLDCHERYAMAKRSAACAADPSQCTSSGTATTTPPDNVKTGKHSSPCEPIVIDGGIPGGYVGGCDSCGIIDGGILYLTNPFDFGTIRTDVTTVTGGQQLNVSLPPLSSGAIYVGPSYLNGPVYVWP